MFDETLEAKNDGDNRHIICRINRNGLVAVRIFDDNASPVRYVFGIEFPRANQHIARGESVSVKTKG
jgi:hypothetical protein